MAAAGIDMSQFVRKPLAEAVMTDYDLIISMATKADTPTWLLASPKYLFWDVPDPRGQNFENTTVVRDKIRAKVSDLIKNNSENQVT